MITATNAVPNQAPKPLPFKANVTSEPPLEAEGDRSPDETEEITMPPPMQPFDSLVSEIYYHQLLIQVIVMYVFVFLFCFFWCWTSSQNMNWIRVLNNVFVILVCHIICIDFVIHLIMSETAMHFKHLIYLLLVIFWHIHLKWYFDIYI